jgi:Holliday junction DNA helicase RuvA
MISYLSGNLKRLPKEGLRVMVEAGGVGYEVLLPFFVKRALEEEGREGQPVEFEVFYYVTERQPRPVLIGFIREHEKTFFERLIEVEDVGPSKAASALVLSVSTVARAIEDGDVATLRKLPGIGERTANKIVATLRGKVAEWALLQDEGYDSVPRAEKEQRPELVDAVTEALVGLGYRRPEAKLKVEQALERVPEVKDEQALIREVFRAERAR